MSQNCPFFTEFMKMYAISGSAAGYRIPPLMIFQGKRMTKELKQILPNKMHGDCSESGWMNADIFYNYISKTFYPWLEERRISTPVVLFVDGHISHRSLKLSEFCLQHKIILVSFLPNTTHIIQPMNAVIFGPVKRKWAEVLNEFKNSKCQMDRMTNELFYKNLKMCMNETFTSVLLKSAFVETGLHPFDPKKCDYPKLRTRKNTEKVAALPDASESNPMSYSSKKFLGNLENLIKSMFPTRLNEFQRTEGSWKGDPVAKDLFEIWKKAGGEAIGAADIDVNKIVFDLDDATGLFIQKIKK